MRPCTVSNGVYAREGLEVARSTYRRGDVVEVNCWAHAPGYSFKAVGSDPECANIALGFFGALFRIERTLAEALRKKKQAIRESRSRPIVDAFSSWCDAQAGTVLDTTPSPTAPANARKSAGRSFPIYLRRTRAHPHQL
jgi:transposase